MITSTVRRFLGLVLLLVLATSARASTDYTGDTYLDFNAMGQSSYDVYITSGYIAPDALQGTASCWASFAGYSGTSSTPASEADVQIWVSNVHQVHGQWVADSISISILNPNTYAYTHTIYYNVPVPTASWARGAFYIASATYPVRITVY